VVFGEYAGKTNTALFTHRRDSANSPSPAIVELCGKRLVTCQEPDEGSKMSTGILKELSGGDKLTGRDLNMPLKTFTPTHRIFMMCNDKPDIDTTDDGTWRRMRNIRYVSKFVEHDDARLQDQENYPYHYKKDPRIPEKFSNWAPILLFNLFERFKMLAKMNFNVVVPESVRADSRDYKAEHNIYASFLRDKMIKSDPKDKLSIKDAFGEFVIYAKESNFKVSLINKNTFQMNIERIMGVNISTKTGKWRGWTLASYITQETQDSEATDTEKKTKKTVVLAKDLEAID
jgi:putative DNA primase/helicase